ncbi:MAG TPA: HAMP domain-containing protein [Ktedonobacteraceae bacterium]|nr:HAMP domain-containing protein [Ktedonobacteraceae bacterium]
MWRFLTNMSITQRIMIAAAITALIPGLVISVLGSSYINTLSTINDTVQVENNAVNLATKMQADLLRMNALLEVLNVAPSSAADNVQNMSEISQLTSDFGSTLTTYGQNYQISTSSTMQTIRATLQNDSQGNQAPSSQHTMIYVVTMQWGLYEKAQSQVLQDMHTANPSQDALAADVAQANLEYLPLKGNVDNLVGITESISQIVAEINSFKIQPTIFWTVMAFLFSTLVVFAVSYLINLTITRPLRQLVTLTTRIAQGETNARAVVVGHDETYMVATSLNTMLDSIVRLMKNIQRQHDFLEDRVQDLISEIKGLGSGDLRTRAEVTSDALGFLAHSFNCMVDELSNLVVRVKVATDEIEILTRTTQLRMTQLVSVSGHQIQNMLEAVKAVEQMADTAFTIAEQSQVLAKIARETHQATLASRETARSSKALIPLLDVLERQTLAIESINTNLNQQVHLSQSAFCLIKDAAEASNSMHDQTQEADHQLHKLINTTTRLHALVGAFKLREEPRIHPIS